MNELILALNNIDFNWSIIESIAIFFSIIYVILAAKKNIWCWAASIISVLLYIYICFKAHIYAESVLHVFYLFMAMYGYYYWEKDKQGEQVYEWGIKKHLFIILFGAIASFLMGFCFSIFTSAAMPILDSFTTIFSVIATYMIVKKVLENWLYWIVIDIASVYLYFSRDLHLTSILFIIYTIIAVFGYLSWLKKSSTI